MLRRIRRARAKGPLTRNRRGRALAGVGGRCAAARLPAPPGRAVLLAGAAAAAILLVVLACAGTAAAGGGLPDPPGTAPDTACLPLEKQLEETLGSGGPPLEACVRLLDCWHGNGGVEQGLERLIGFTRETPSRPDLDIAAGYGLQLAGRDAEALSRIADALSQGEESPEARRLAGAVQLRCGAPAEAARTLQEALASEEAQSAGDRVLAETAYNLGLARHAAGELQGALEAYRQSLEHGRLADRPGLENGARIGCAQVLLALGRPSDALPLFREAAGSAHPEASRRQLHQAAAGELHALLLQGRYVEAEAAGAHALAAFGDSAVLNNLLGRALFGLGEYGRAREAFLASRTQAAGAENDPLVRMAGVHTANIDWILGNLAEARRAYQEEAELARRAGDPSGEADGRTGLGLTAQASGLWEEAAQHHQAARDLATAAGDERRAGMAANNLGLVRMAGGDPAAAGLLFESSARSFQRAGDLPGLATALSNLGEALRLEGRWEEAAGRMQESEAVLSETGSRRGKALNDLRLGRLSLDRGDGPAALERFQSSVRLARVDGDADLEWRALCGLGAVAERAGGTAEALALYRSAVEVLERRYREMGPPRVDLVLRIDADGLYEAVIRLLIREHRTDEAFQYVEKDRWRDRLERLGAAVFPESGGGREAAHAFTAAQRRLDAYRDALARGGEGPEPNAAETRGEIRERMRACRQEQARLLGEIERTEPALHASLTGSRLEIGGICRGIPEDTALVEYYQTGDELFLFTLDRDGLRVFRSAADEGGLRDDCRALKDLIVARGSAPASAGELHRVSSSLYRQLIEPAREVIHGKKNLGVVPHRSLHDLPFSVLTRRGGDGRVRYLVEDHRVFRIHVRDYARYLAHGGGPRGELEGLVGFADPDGTLPGSRQEVLRAGEIFPGARIFVGHRASEGTAKRVSQEAGFLVFALHGVSGGGPGNSFLRLAADGREDGCLTQTEVAGLRLRNRPVVVLSACESGSGTWVRGTGWTSLADAFVAAGARSVISALWEVEDGATRLFMDSLYRSLKAEGPAESLRAAQLAFLNGRLSGDPAGEPGAVRGAGKPRTFSGTPAPGPPGDYAHPYYWGAFVMHSGSR